MRGTDAPAADDDGAQGAVPHRTYPDVNAPWAPPGAYTVRLTVGRTRYTQPLTLRLDPRVTTSAAELARLATLSTSTYDAAVATNAAYVQARALAARLERLPGADAAALRAQIDSLAPAAGGRASGRGARRGGGAANASTLDGATAALVVATMAMQGADVAPTAGEIAAVARAREQAAAVMRRWNALRTTRLAELNARRRAAGETTVAGAE